MTDDLVGVIKQQSVSTLRRTYFFGVLWGFQPLEAAKTFSAFSLAQRRDDPHLIGYLCTTWSRAKTVNLSTWPPITEILPKWEGN